MSDNKREQERTELYRTIWALANELRGSVDGSDGTNTRGDCSYKPFNDISEGLPAEIEARQKQYEYYRDKLLTFKKKEAAENE